MAELADHTIYEALGLASGHTLKHLLAATASAVIVAGLVWRARHAPSEEADEGVSVSLWDILTLPGFHVHQIVGKFLMNGGSDGQERSGAKPAVHG